MTTSVTSSVTGSVTQNVTGSTGSPLLNGLVAWWSLDEVSGFRSDSHGGYDLADGNTVGSTTGVVGLCADFVAANNEYLRRTDVQPGTSSFSIATWLYVKSGAALGAPFGTRSSAAFGTAPGYRPLMLDSGSVATISTNSIIEDDGGNYVAVGTNTSTGIAVNTWFHLAMVVDRDNNTWRFYINGNATPIIDKDISSLTGSITAGVGDFTIGANGTQQQPLGMRADEFAYYHAAIGVSTISALSSGIGYPG